MSDGIYKAVEGVLHDPNFRATYWNDDKLRLLATDPVSRRDLVTNWKKVSEQVTPDEIGREIERLYPNRPMPDIQIKPPPIDMDSPKK